MDPRDTRTGDTGRHPEPATISRRWEWAGIIMVTLAALLLRVWQAFYAPWHDGDDVVIRLPLLNPIRVDGRRVRKTGTGR